ncbi:unnamed protein product [Paramecium octaurelia]|uniref:Uncharacterized protein n=1 Tax=Paramecium octaurelia TaxID=43137 RepID=A0A8S1WRX2_PAROT|nr:unnamed protein product [Paramecium octaurelia]
MLLTTTSQRNEIQTQPQNSYKQIQQSGDQSNVQIQILPTYQNYHIFKKSKPCDILYPCKKNYFEKKLSDKERDNSEQEWTIMEESNYFYNYCCSQYRSFKLCAKYGSVEQYVGRRSKNVFCQDILMEITKQGEQEKIGEIQAISPEFKTECKKSFIYTKPLIKIVYFVNNVEAQVLVITLAKTTFHNYYLRQCCLPFLPQVSVNCDFILHTNNVLIKRISCVNIKADIYCFYMKKQNKLNNSIDTIKQFQLKSFVQYIYICLGFNHQNYKLQYHLYSLCFEELKY